MDYSKLKLVIWDLDDTFWEGTLSEGGIHTIPNNIELIKRLTDCGVVNTICSKNDETVAFKQLSKLGIRDLFVFSSINWDAKGPRIKELLQNMGLRAANCLFIDDNTLNLNEALFYEPSLNVAEPTVITELIDYFTGQKITDATHSRLKNYQVLERKNNAKSQAADNLAFLFDSQTNVEIHYDCESQIDRIAELVLRTNQLNFTKTRASKEELLSTIKDCNTKSGYVTVSDRFGEYGIVGFFAIKDNVCIHFLFSCRTIGQGVEQYVYATLGYPKLAVIGEVISMVDSSPAPEWINISTKSQVFRAKRTNTKVIFKGGCDLQITADYLKTDNIFGEFTYTGRKGNNMEMINHSINYLYFSTLSVEEKLRMLKELQFSDPDMFDTHIFDSDTALVLVSTMIEPNLGVYKNKSTGQRIAFGEKCHPLTDSKEWDNYINNNIFTADNHFTKEWLCWFSEQYTFEGALSPEEILENAKQLLAKLHPATKLCYFLGVEIPYLKNDKKNYEDRHLVYKQINTLFREWAKKEKRVLLIDFNDYVHDQNDFNDNINHFVRRVYYDAAKKINSYISDITGQKAVQSSKIKMLFLSLVDIIGRTGFYQSKIYSVLRLPYVWAKNIVNK